jgi:hypothetical protein
MVSMQSINGDEVKIIPMDSIESLERLANATYNDISTETSLKIINERLYRLFYCGYEAIVGDVAVGWSYSKCDAGIFTLDGCNAGVSIFVASKMGKMVCAELFSGGIETILSMHKAKQRHVTALIKRIGFKKLLSAEDRTLFYKVKSWE